MAGTIRLDVVDAADIRGITSSVDILTLGNAVEPELVKLMDDFYTQQATSLGSATAFNVVDARVVGYLSEWATVNLKSVNTTTQRQLALELAKGVANGEGEAALAKRVRKVFKTASITRAKLIARTEVTAASNAVRDMAMVDSGVVKKRKWLATRDSRTRRHHLSLNGQTKKLSQPFKIPGTSKTARYPGGFADVGENVNCRCVVVAVIDRIVIDAEDGPVVPEDADRDGVKNYDELAAKWDKRMERAYRRGFRAQEKEALRQLSRRA